MTDAYHFIPRFTRSCRRSHRVIPGLVFAHTEVMPFLFGIIALQLWLANAEDVTCCSGGLNRESSWSSFQGRDSEDIGEQVVKGGGERGERRLIKGATFHMGSDRPKVVGDGEGPSRVVVRL